MESHLQIHQIFTSLQCGSVKLQIDSTKVEVFWGQTIIVVYKFDEEGNLIFLPFPKLNEFG